MKRHMIRLVTWESEDSASVRTIMEWPISELLNKDGKPNAEFCKVLREGLEYVSNLENADGMFTMCTATYDE